MTTLQILVDLSRMKYELILSMMTQFQWNGSGDNPMILNTRKYNLLVSECNHKLMFAYISDESIWEGNSIKLFGILIDSDLTFDNHLKIQCKNLSKLTAYLHIMSHFIGK